MRNAISTTVAFLLLTFFYVIVPALTVWGWIRWARRPRTGGFASIASLISFALATASALLAAASIIRAHEIGGFPYYDPRLLRIYRQGFHLSAGAFLFSFGGLWGGSNPLRWHAIVCAVGNALFWFSAAMGE